MTTPKGLNEPQWEYACRRLSPQSCKKLEEILARENAKARILINRIIASYNYHVNRPCILRLFDIFVLSHAMLPADYAPPLHFSDEDLELADDLTRSTCMRTGHGGTKL